MQLGNRLSQHQFSIISNANVPRSKFDRSFAMKTTFDFDYLVPIFVDEILPGDVCNLQVNTFARLATQKVPIMDNLYLDFFFFFVPNRLVWENWERFNGAQDDPADSTSFILPVTDTDTGVVVGTLYDHFGIPTEITDLEFQNLPGRAYNLIWNEWFRDENILDSVPVDKDNGPDAITDYVLLKRGKRHDYFTACLPWPQKGPAVELPLGTYAPVIGIGAQNQSFNTAGQAVYDSAGENPTYTFSKQIDPSSNDETFFVERDPDNTGYPRIRADLSNATAATINQLRQAFSVQSLYELDARGGTRYVEILKAHFGVISPDFRLQRPEYLGGGSTKINSHPVPQTSPTSGSNPQGQLAAFATQSTAGERVGFSKSFVEHGYVIGLAAARADLTYQQGLNRMWSRSTRFDFYWPKLAELGEQAVLNKEIYAQGSTVTTPGLSDPDTFGYIPRYDEYRYKPSEIHGEFRSTFATSLDFWHMSEEFSACPVLESDFIESNTPIDRALAVTGAPQLLFDAYYRYIHARPMPTYSVPASLGRF